MLCVDWRQTKKPPVCSVTKGKGIAPCKQTGDQCMQTHASTLGSLANTRLDSNSEFAPEQLAMHVEEKGEKVSHERGGATGSKKGDESAVAEPLEVSDRWLHAKTDVSKSESRMS
jgi:hypothetical protein